MNVGVAIGIALNYILSRNFGNEGIVIIIGTIVILQNCLLHFESDFITTRRAFDRNNGFAIGDRCFYVIVVVVSTNFISYGAVLLLTRQTNDKGRLFCARASVFGYFNNLGNGESTVLASVCLCFFVVVKGIFVELNVKSFSARTTVSPNVVALAAIVPIGMEESITLVMCTVRFRIIIAILTSGNYGNARFTVSIFLILESIGILIFMLRLMSRLPAAGTNFCLTDCIALGVVTVDIAAFFYIIVVARALQAAVRTFIYLNAVLKSCFIGVGIIGNIIVSTVVSVRPALLTASTAVNLKVTVARAIVCKFVVYCADYVVAIICPFAYVVAIAAGFFYNNACCAVLVGFIQERVSVLVIMVSAA